MTELVAITVLSRSKKAASTRAHSRTRCSKDLDARTGAPYGACTSSSSSASGFPERLPRHVCARAPCARPTNREALVLVCFWSPKGGSGTSVITAAAALVLAREDSARLADLSGDQPAILGLAGDPEQGLRDWLSAGPEAPTDALDRLAVDAGRGLAILAAGAGELGVASAE